MAKPIPDGYSTITAHLTISDPHQTVDFYKRGLGAEELFNIPTPDGRVMHMELKIGNSIFMVAEAGQMGSKSPKDYGGASSSIMLYTEDVDALFQRAVAAGATVKMPPQDMFWGDRWAMIEDTSGHVWQMATHKEDVPPEEMSRRFEEMMKQQKPQ